MARETKQNKKELTAGLKVPPQNTEAEQSVLGAILLDKAAITKVADVVRPDDFYRDQHQIIYQGMLDLFEKRSPIDVVTLTNELEGKKLLEDAGGASYLSTLVNGVPSAAHVVRYAEIVSQKATLRRLITAATEITEMGFEDNDSIAEVLDRAESKLFSVGQSFLHENFISISSILEESFDRIDQLHKNKGALRGVPTGFKDLDNLLSGVQNSDLIIVASRPSMGKTSFALNITEYAAVKAEIPVGVFSLEQSREQIVDRLLCQAAGVDLWKLRTGNLNEDDFPKINYAMGALSEAKIFIDDSPMINAMEIRAKARRLQAEHGLGLVIIDYLQLMEGRSKSGDNNRVQEVSEISRSLKALARELNVPVIALSQLSRAVEQRDRKIPQLSDLRESGCLSGDTLIYNAKNGRREAIRDLIQDKRLFCLALNKKHRLVKVKASKVFATGKKKIYKIELTSGLEIKATANHNFLTISGWKRLDELQKKSFIAKPRIIDFKGSTEKLSDGKIILLAHLIGDGCYLQKQPLHYTNSDPQCIVIVDKVARQEFGTINRRVKRQTWEHLYLTAPYKLARGRRNPIVRWLDEELGIFDQRSGVKQIPEAIFSLNKKKLALFLSHLFATDGGITKSAGLWKLHYASKSRRLVEDVYHLLVRFGICGRIKINRKKGYASVYDLVINGVDNQKKFMTQIGIFGAKSQSVELAKVEIDHITANTNVDIIPKDIWTYIKNQIKTKGWSHREFHQKMGWSYSGTQRYGNGISRERLNKIAEVLGDTHLAYLATSDIFWDQIKEIREIGVEEVYDITIPKTHNFIANDIIVHNSIEQDADIVMFIYREDYYNKDTDNKNIADILVRKHRNGPTGDVKLYFMPEQTKFANLDKKFLAKSERGR